MADAGTSFLLLHPCEGVPQVLPLLTAALRAHLDTGAPHLPPIPGAARPTLFHAPAAPRIDVEAYVQRLYRYTKCSPACLVMAYSYIQRLAAGDALLRPSPFNVHRMLIAGTMLAVRRSVKVLQAAGFYCRPVCTTHQGCCHQLTQANAQGPTSCSTF